VLSETVISVTTLTGGTFSDYWHNTDISAGTKSALIKAFLKHQLVLPISSSETPSRISRSVSLKHLLVLPISSYETATRISDQCL
jgi:hypothetical protein